MFTVHHQYLPSLWFWNVILQENCFRNWLIVFNGKWLTVRISDSAKKHMESFLLAVKNELQDQFLWFTEKEALGNKFLSKFFYENDKYHCLWKV